MTANSFVIFCLLGLGFFAAYQFYRIAVIVRGGNDREQRFKQMMIVEQARMDMLKKKADQAAKAVPVSTIGKSAADCDLYKGLSA